MARCAWKITSDSDSPARRVSTPLPRGDLPNVSLVLCAGQWPEGSLRAAAIWKGVLRLTGGDSGACVPQSLSPRWLTVDLRSSPQPWSLP